MFSISYTLIMLLVKPILSDSLYWLFLWAKSPVKCVNSLPAEKSTGQHKAKRNKRLMLDSQDSNRKRDRLMGQQSASVRHVYTCPWWGRAFPNFDVEMKRRWQNLEAFQRLRKHILSSPNPSSWIVLKESETLCSFYGILILTSYSVTLQSRWKSNSFFHEEQIYFTWFLRDC